MANNIEKKVQELLEKIINDLGYDLYDVLYVKEGKEYYLKIFIDKPEGISIEDCENVNNAIDEILDTADYIKEQYFLEVSSPGIERDLRKEKHFLAQIGNEIEVKLYKQINSKKELRGILEEYNDNEIVLNINNEKINIELKSIAMAKTIYNW